jgi:predicted nucleotidyltransferase
MRKKSASEALLFPHIRQRVLATFLLRPKREWYLSDLARTLKCAPGHLHRELALLLDAGILRRRVEGRQVYYSPDPDCPYLQELTALVRKTMGIDIVLARALKPMISKIRCAFVYGSVAKGEEKSASDIDLMIVGDVTITDLLPGLTRAERELGRPVNPTIYPEIELVQKFRGGNHFVRAMLAEPAKTFVIGTRHELEKTANGRSDQGAHDQQERTRRTSRRRPG